jgi:PAS domain S-box-containing protein
MQRKLKLASVLNFSDEELSEDARLIKNYFTQLIEHFPNNVYWVDADGVLLGCNKNVVQFVGVKSAKDIIGKNYKEISEIAGWTKEQGESLQGDDKEVITTGKSKLNVIEPVFYDHNGNEIHYISTRIPLFDEGVIVGVAGISVEISDRVKKERLEIENNSQKIQLQEKEKFAKVVDQVAHDIRSPLSALLMTVKSCPEIPETQRVALREAAISITDITNNLLQQYKFKEVENPNKTVGPESMLCSAILLQLLTEKKYQYQELPVKFYHDFSQAGHFAFIRIEPSSFRRMMSNLINNAVDSFDNREGKVVIKLDADRDFIQLTIEDGGKGMSPEVMNKILNKISVTEGKKDGNGLGMTQVGETLERFQGKLYIHSAQGQGTQMKVTFPRIKAPNWIAEEIILDQGDIVVILDDDSSIHGAWNAHFASVIKTKTDLQIKHFEIGHEALDFINTLTTTEKRKVFLLSDYELLKQNLNGLNVIEQSSVPRSILVTSHYANADVRNQATQMGIKILPKQMASEIPITINAAPMAITIVTESLIRVVDLVIVEDSTSFAESIIAYLEEIRGTKDKPYKIDFYSHPKKFLDNLSQYSRETKISLDNDFGIPALNGINLADQLHEQGYTNLYLLSGKDFVQGEIPPYLTFISKTDLDKIAEQL